MNFHCLKKASARVCVCACACARAVQSMDSSELSDGPITLQEYLEVKKALASSEAKVQQLMKVNNNLSEELRRLQKEVGGAAHAPPGRKTGGRSVSKIQTLAQQRPSLDTCCHFLLLPHPLCHLLSH